MIRRTIYDLVHLGSSVRYLRERSAGNIIWLEGDADAGHMHVRASIDRLLLHFTDFDLHVTLRASEKLRRFRATLEDRPSGDRLTKEEGSTLKTIIVELEATFQAEALGLYAFFVAEKSTPMSTLTEHPGKLFPRGVFDRLSPLAEYDVREACFCRAFSRHTAVAFHILRATEETLRQYYCALVKNKRVKSQNWDPILRDFARRRKKPSDTLLRNLDYIRQNFRNPTAHPDARYTDDEAQSLFNLCVDVIVQMYRDSRWPAGS